MAEFSCRPRQVDGDGAAKRRRLRRWRHEQQTVAAVLATYQHHSTPRGPRSARTGGGARDELHGYAPEDAPSQSSRLPCLGVPRGPHARVQRRTVQQIVDAVPLVPLLDDPVPQMVDTVLEFFRALDLPVVEQVIAVPKISTDRVSQRLVERRLPQMVEQLVDVPTVLTPTRIALQIAEQLVNFPVPQVSVSGGGHQGSLSGQGSVGEQVVDIPVPRGRGKRRVQGFSPRTEYNSAVRRFVS